MPRLPLTTHGRAIVISAASIIFATAIIGAARSVRDAWQAKADTAFVNAAVRGLADSLHVIHVQGDSTALRVRQMWCKDKITEGCR